VKYAAVSKHVISFTEVDVWWLLVKIN